MAEDYLKQVTVGEVEAHGGTIRLCPYDPRRADRDRYAAEKQRLAERQWAYVQDYADAKTAVVAEILERIRQAGLLPN